MRTHLLRLWRAAEHTMWPDIVLAVALSLVAVWFTVHMGESLGDKPDALRLGAPPDKPIPPAIPPDDPRGWAGVTGDALLNVLMTAPLFGRRRWPLPCLVVQFAGLLAYHGGVNAATLPALLIGAYSLAIYGRSALGSLAVLLGAAAATAAVKHDTWPPLPDWSGVFAILLPLGLFGVAIRSARGRALAADERAAAVRREQVAATRLAVANERARIARELHDVVSHHVSVMTIQAGAAGKVLDADPELARGALSAIEAGGRETMSELRHLLGLLTPGSSDDDLLRPQPGLEQLDALVDNVRRAGQPVSVRRVPAQLPRGMDLTAYRVVQEALTNALRYAPGARTEIDIGIGTEPPADLVIEVTNDAPPSGTHQPSGGSGSGLLGLAERLRIYGGTLETGRRVGGGFRVRARLPLEVGP